MVLELELKHTHTKLDASFPEISPLSLTSVSVERKVCNNMTSVSALPRHV